MIGINFIYLSGHLPFDYDLWDAAPEDCEIMGCYVGNCFNIVWAIIFTYFEGNILFSEFATGKVLRVTNLINLHASASVEFLIQNCLLLRSMSTNVNFYSATAK